MNDRADDCVLVLCTAPADVAESLAQRLVEARLAACVNLIPGLLSLFRWEGRVDRAQEILLMCKTVRGRQAELTAQLAAWHPYDVPEVIVVPVSGGLPQYLEWVRRSCMPESREVF